MRFALEAIAVMTHLQQYQDGGIYYIQMEMHVETLYVYSLSDPLLSFKYIMKPFRG